MSPRPALAVVDLPGASSQAPAAPQVIRVVIADGHALVRAGIRQLLEGHSRIRVIGEAASGEEAVELALQAAPDVVMIDARVPGLDSVHATEQIGDAGVAVMLLAPTEDDERIFAALRAGASGLLLKDIEPAELVRGIEALARGDALVSPSLTRRLIEELTARPEPVCPSAELLDELTAREREVVALVGHGLGNHEIAERLVVTPGTAKTHVSRAMMKLHARTRAQLVGFAYETGLVVARTRRLAGA
jgi:DNA-binding NarL/FixJ family response regulator